MSEEQKKIILSLKVQLENANREAQAYRLQVNEATRLFNRFASSTRLKPPTEHYWDCRVERELFDLVEKFILG